MKTGEKRSRSRLFLEHKGVRIYWISRPRKRGRLDATWLSMRADTNQLRWISCAPGIMFAPSGLVTWKGVPLRPDRMKDAQGHYYDTGHRYGHEPDYIEAVRVACREAIDLGLITKGKAPEDAR